MKCDKVIEQILSAAHKFKETQKTESVEVVVSSKMFTEICHKLTNVRIDKTWQSGNLGSLHIRTDEFLSREDTVTCFRCFKPMSVEDLMCPGDFLPAFIDPEVEKLRKHIENAKKKEAE